MRSLQTVFRYLLCGSIACSFLAGCKRVDPVDPSLQEEQKVTFRLGGFTATVTPLSSLGAKGSAKLAYRPPGLALAKLKNIQPGLEPQYLHYWSFNDGDLLPDVSIDEENARIEFEANNMNATFPAGFALSPYEAGQAWSITGIRWVEIDLPIEGVSALTSLAFDVSSSNTGPKDFSISYSVDNGLTYETLSVTNQFSSMGAQARNSYSFGLSTISQIVGNRLLKVRLEFAAGDREGAGDYNANAGTTRLDNIRLSGVYDVENSPDDVTAPSMLRYYIFSQEDGSVVQAQQLRLEDLNDGNLEVRLKQGTYNIVFLAYHSDAGVLLPDGLSWANAFYFGQHFDDYRAVTYGLLMEGFAVGNEDRQEPAILKRCYSLVEFNFTDLPGDLLTVRKIVLTRQHDNFLYLPFGTPGTLPVSDAQSISFNNLSEVDDYKIRFHQFLGLVDEARNVSYELTAFGENGDLLNTVTVSNGIPNNVHLLFTGSLLGDLDRTNGFGIEIGTDWDDVVEGTF